MDQRGVYLLANDVSYDWLVALVRSLRRVNPAVRIVLIPFDERTSRTGELIYRFGGEIWSDGDLLARLDSVGRLFHPNNAVGARLFRKFAIFEGPLETFLYLDADCIFKISVDPIFEAIRRRPTSLLFSDVEPASMITNDGHAITPDPCFNAGILAGSRHLFSVDEIDMLALDLLSKRIKLVSGEQSFLNLMAAQKSVALEKMSQVVKGFPEDTFSQRLRRGSNGRTLAATPVVHWAGEQLSPRMHGWNEYLRYRLDRHEPVDAARFLLWDSLLRPYIRSRASRIRHLKI